MLLAVVVCAKVAMHSNVAVHREMMRFIVQSIVLLFMFLSSNV